MVNELPRYIKAYLQFLRNSIATEMEYRASFVFKNLASLIWMIGALFFIHVLFTQVSTVGGWSKDEILLLYVSFSLAADTMHVFLRKNFERFSSLTRKGELDWLLLRPINSRFMVSLMTGGVDINSIFRLLSGFGLFIYFLPTGTSIMNILMFFVFQVLGMLAVYSFTYILHTLNIWFVRLDNITHLSFMILDLSRVPLDSWPSGVRLFLIYIIPVGIFSTFAVKTLTSGPNYTYILISIVVVVALFVASQKFWHFALKHYSSASS
jgi:ABC-2 type transport system permease protein